MDDMSPQVDERARLVRCKVEQRRRCQELEEQHSYLWARNKQDILALARRDVDISQYFSPEEEDLFFEKCTEAQVQMILSCLVDT